jgi:hypothetical protein
MKRTYIQSGFSLTAALLLGASATLPAHAADYPSTVLSQGPVGYWRLNETTAPPPTGGATNIGTLGNSATAIYSNTPTRGLTGPFAGSVSVGLDGISQSINTPWQAAYNPTGPFTIEIWANPTQVPKFAYLAASGHLGTPRSGWYLAQDDNSTFGYGNGFVFRSFYQNANNPSLSLFVTNDLPLGSWYHLVVAFDGTSATFYKNGVAVTNAVALGYVGNVDAPFTVGERSDHAFNWPGKVAETAIYTSSLSAARVTAHYSAATGSPATYAATVQADSPALYYRYQEAPSPVAANAGSLGTAADGLYFYNALPNQVGPRPASSPTPFPGFTSGNTAVAFDGNSGSIKIPALNLNTNRVTITCWIKPNGDTTVPSAGVFGTSGTSGAGLQFDILTQRGLTYNWNNDPLTVNWDSSIILPDAQWSFAALIVQPDKAVLYVPGNPPATNIFNHTVIPFNAASFIGSTNGSGILNGTVDEVAIWNRTLGLGEVYSQYAAAAGGLGPQIFSDPQNANVVVGDTLTVAVDAGGTPNLSYQWRKDSVAIPGATTNPYSKPNAVLGDAGSYDVIVTNLFGTVTSGAATITTEVATAPVIVKGPVGRTVYTGGTLNLNVVATGGGLKYQWKRSSTNLPGATSSAYLVNVVSNGNAGSYSVSVTNSLGATTLGPVTVTVPSPASNTYDGLVITAGPEAWWRLNEPAGSTNLFDCMGRHDGYYTNLNGTVPPVVLGVPGVLTNGDTAASFSANGGIGVIPFSSDLNAQTYTYEGWVKSPSVPSAYTVPFSSAYSGNGLWWATIPADGKWYPGGSGGYYGGFVAPTQPIAPGIWMHLVLSYDANRVISGTHYPWSFFVNGVTDGNVWTGVGANGGGPFIIGGRGVDATTLAEVASLFNGQVDEISVYKRVLNNTEIASHYNAGFPSTPPSFTVQPSSQSVFAGESVNLTATAVGSAPLTLQWKKNGVSLPGQTNSTLALTNLYYSASGDTYTIAATNTAGFAISTGAVITVYYPSTFANQTNGLVLHMRFDGNYLDTSGRGNNATAVGAPTLVPGRIGSQALSYSTDTTLSSYNYLSLGNPSDLSFGSSVDFSVAYWVKLPAGSTNGDLPFFCSAENSYGGFGITFAPSYQRGGWSWSLVNSASTTAGLYGPNNSINDGNWHHLAHTFTRTGSGVTFLDGIQVNSTGIAGLGDIDSGLGFSIGQGPTGTYGETGSAILDDLGVWRRALTDIQARSIYKAGQNGKSFDTFGPISLKINKLPGGDIEIIWEAGTLKKASSVTGPWTPVAGATAPYYRFTPGAANTFYGVGP